MTSGPRRPSVSRRKRIRLALRHEPKRLIYPFLGLRRGRLVDPGEVDLARIRRVLVIRELNTVGDALVGTPAVRALAEAHPGLEVGMVAGSRNAAVWRGNPRIRRLFVLGRGSKPARVAQLVREVRRWQPAMCVTLESLRCHATHDVLARLSRAAVRVRYDGSAFGAPHTNVAYTCIVPVPDGAGHQIDLCAGVLRPFGIAPADRRLEMFPGREAGLAAGRVLTGAGVGPGEPFVVIHPGSKQVHNRWPLDRFRTVYEQCRGVIGIRALLSFGPSEEEARGWFRMLPAAERDLLPRLSIDELAALLARARLLICPDTGVLHVGAAVGVPIVGLYGSGDPAVWQPPGPVRAVTDHASGNVQGISVEDALAAVSAALENTAPESPARASAQQILTS